ncbi:M48 family metalloprotease [Paenibacillus sp. SYP-B3998]|uniref:M48 family metalloprotease n=1 Tax=Paenibacillus sp. SYP-B3998 TaxID=2678564 RepID=A0A6G4A2U4_9BACL|nr:M56 family metallopeptidase [Paenibacillus sp. SYP-B3998]NEW08608.1 M48 family metalloprotease [Paenibacillus sp. SYP-B3998]
MNIDHLKYKSVSILMGLFIMILFMQMGFFVAHQLFGVQLGWNLFQYCLSLMDENTYPHITVKMMINSFILYTVTRVLWRLVKQIYLTIKWSVAFQNKQDKKLTRRLNVKYRKWGYELVVVSDDSFIALTMGMIRPKIIVSTGVLNSYSVNEVQAILQHERYHCMRRDPLKIFISTLLVVGLGYIPIFKCFHHYYKTWKELLADRYVIKMMGTEYVLGSVLVKLTERKDTFEPAVGVHFANVAVNYRMLQVLQPEKPIQVPFFHFRPIAISLCMTFLMTVAVWGGCS